MGIVEIKNRIIEIIANNDQDLLNQLDGREVMINGSKRILHTKDAHVQTIEMTQGQKFFNVLANPNIAYFLMILGFYGLLFEVTHPGFGVPGVLGIVFLILAFYSMQTLPTNYAGLALMVLGIIGAKVTPNKKFKDVNVKDYNLLVIPGDTGHRR